MAPVVYLQLFVAVFTVWMPHKRAKRSVRDQQRSEKHADLAPGQQSLSNEAVPKSISRVINAAQIRVDWKEKKRKFEEDGQSGNRHGKKRRKAGGANEKGNISAKVNAESEPKPKDKGKALAILPGESLGHFNERVENDLRPLVKSAMQTSSAVSRAVRKLEIEAKRKKNKTTKTKDGRSPSPSPPPVKHAGHPKEFKITSSSAPRRLNDIVQAPPQFKKLPRGAAEKVGGKKAGPGGVKLDGVLSMAQKVMMEEEREKAILRYREMKQKRRGEGGDDRDRGDDEED